MYLKGSRHDAPEAANEYLVTLIWETRAWGIIRPQVGTLGRHFHSNKSGKEGLPIPKVPDRSCISSVVGITQKAKSPRYVHVT